jgi:chemotaxis signal transduction protein
LEKHFNLVREKKTPCNHIIVSEINANIFGVIVDNVVEVIQVPVSQIKPTPSLVSAKIKADYLSGVVVIGGEAEEGQETGESKEKSRLIILMDLPKLLQEKELLDIGAQVADTANH